MSLVAVTTSSVKTPALSGRRYIGLRISCWCVALGLGALQAWTTRFTMNPDGVSYLDIGDAYWRGDWHNAINAYWSPLYSWILGFFVNIFKPSIYWEYPLVHLVNFLIYVAALGCFDYFLVTFIADRQRREADSLKSSEMGLPGAAWWLLGYSLFVSSSLTLIGLHLVTPDVCVSGFIYLASCLLLRIYSGDANRRTFAAFGAALGLAYLAKAVMFPLGLVFLAVAGLISRKNAASRSRMTLATLIFLMIGGSFALALTHAKKRVTFGDSGPITYEISSNNVFDNSHRTYETFANNVGVFAPEGPELKHPISTIFAEPSTKEFSVPVAGTYPLWFDPSYWHEGIRPRFSFTHERRVLLRAVLMYLFIGYAPSLQLNFAVLLGTLYVLTRKHWSSAKTTKALLPLAIPALLALLAYSLVYAESRYVAPFLCVLWMVGFAGIRTSESGGMRRLLEAATALATLATIFPIVAVSLKDNLQSAPDYVDAAVLMRDAGITPGDEVAVIAREPFGSGGAFAARLDRVRIIAETRETGRVLELDSHSRQQFIDSLAKTGAKAALAESLPPGFAPCFEKLGDTEFSLCKLEGRRR